jgi:colicin import membrane protein
MDAPNTDNQLAILEPTREAAIALYTSGKVSDFLERMKAEVRSVVTDPTTDKGRKEIASLAYKVAKTKARLDELGKNLTEDARATINRVNEERRLIREELDTLKDEVRRPLTEFEEREKARVAGHEAQLEGIRELALELDGLPAQVLAVRIAGIESMPARDWQEFTDRATLAKAAALDKLRAAHAARVKYEAERAELARLRAEAEERARKDREEQIAREAAERARKEAEAKAQQEREQAERAAAEQLRKEREAAERAAREAVEKARREAEAKAAKERAEAEAKLRAEREAREKIEREQREAQAREQAEKEAEAERKRAAEAAPDKQKLLALVYDVRSLVLPVMATKEGAALVERFRASASSLADKLEAAARGLGKGGAA